MAELTAGDTPISSSRVVSLGELFAGFFQIAIFGFGGVMPWARRMIVEQRGWLNDAEFNELLGLCQFLPGPNVVNLSICVGARFQGWRGSVVSFTALLALPFWFAVAGGYLYVKFGDLSTVRGAMAGVSSAAAGLVIAMGAKMARSGIDSPRAAAVVAAGVVAVAIMRWPVGWLLLVLVPSSILLARLLRK
jgi:chromate transporter